MAIIYDTTMRPGKLELLTTWLPAQSWYLGGVLATAEYATGPRSGDH